MRNNKGFTLMEVIVVVLIIGVLFAMALPRLAKTVETSRANDALGVLNNIASGVRMFKSDWASGTLSPSAALSTALNSTACPGTGKPTSVGQLLGCRYVNPQDWDHMMYLFYVCEADAPAGTCCAASAAGENRIACADRRDTDPSSGAATDNSYKSWLFWIDNYGGCHSGTTANNNPPCPKV